MDGRATNAGICSVAWGSPDGRLLRSLSATCLTRHGDDTVDWLGTCYLETQVWNIRIRYYLFREFSPIIIRWGGNVNSDIVILATVVKLKRGKSFISVLVTASDSILNINKLVHFKNLQAVGWKNIQNTYKYTNVVLCKDSQRFKKIFNAHQTPFPNERKVRLRQWPQDVKPLYLLRLVSSNTTSWVVDDWFQCSIQSSWQHLFCFSDAKASFVERTCFRCLIICLFVSKDDIHSS